MVMVYHFKVYDGTNDKFLVPPRKSTAERIGRVGGQLIEETGEDVPDSALDDDGRYDPDA